MVNNDGTHAAREESGLIALQAGLHPVTVLFFENAGQEELEVSWTPPGQSKAAIGDGHFVYDTDNLLPVELVSFEALVDQNEVVLTWETASELNNAGFFVERALESETTFETIGYVEGAGSTDQARRYEFRDTRLPVQAASATYRLKQVDFDGQVEFSPSVHAQRAPVAKAQLYSNYPNPFNPSTLLSFSLPTAGPIRLSVYDISGRHIETLIEEDRAAGFHELTFDADPSLSSGMYIYRLTTPYETISGRMLLLK